jgi:hypothetical protein
MMSEIGRLRTAGGKGGVAGRLLLLHDAGHGACGLGGQAGGHHGPAAGKEGLTCLFKRLR